MGLKEKLMKLIGIKKEDVKVTYNIVPTNLQVCIDNEELLVRLGQWMDIYPDSVKHTEGCVTVYEDYEPRNFLRRHKITVAERDEIENRFARILQCAGFDMEDICVLEQFDDENLSFNGSFLSLTNDVNISLRFGDFFEEPRNIRICHDGVYAVYNYSHTKNKTDMITLDTVTKDLDNGKKFHRYVSEFTYYGDVYDDENRVEVEVGYPEALANGNTIDNPYVFTQTMEEVLSSVTFPVDIEDLCSKIASGLKGDVSLFPRISVVVKKTINDKSVVTDEAKFKEGKFEKLVITKNGRKVTIDRFNNWSYDTDTHTVNHMAQDEVSYGIKGMPIDQLEAMPTPQELVSSAEAEIENVRGISYTLFNKKSKSN